MSYKYTGASGMVPNIGELTTGDTVSDQVAEQLRAAGYDVAEQPEAQPEGENQ